MIQITFKHMGDVFFFKYTHMNMKRTENVFFRIQLSPVMKQQHFRYCSTFKVQIKISNSNTTGCRKGEMLGFCTGEGFTAHLCNPNALGAGVDKENWLNFGVGLLSFLTISFPSLGRDTFPWAGSSEVVAALLGHFGKVRNCPTTLNKSTGDGNWTWHLSKRNHHLHLWILAVIPGIRMFLK